MPACTIRLMAYQNNNKILRFDSKPEEVFELKRIWVVGLFQEKLIVVTCLLKNHCQGPL